MFTEILQMQSLYDNALFGEMREIEKAKLMNAQLEEFVLRRDQLADLVQATRKHVDSLTKLRAAVIREDNLFRENRIEYLNAVITEALADIFPEEKLTAKLHCDFSRTDTVELVLYDELGNEYLPDICAGKLMQYLISFAAITGITLNLGVHNIFIDEAFGVASPDIMGQIGEVVQRRIADGLQIVMIAQNSALYQDLPRHEIRLRKDEVTKVTFVVEEIDF